MCSHIASSLCGEIQLKMEIKCYNKGNTDIHFVENSKSIELVISCSVTNYFRILDKHLEKAFIISVSMYQE